MSWDFSGRDAWETTTMSSALPTYQAKDEDAWGSWDSVDITNESAAQTAGNTDGSNTNQGEDFSFGCLNDQPVQDDTCRRCKKPGHFAKNCPEPVVCFNCGEAGHNKSDCTNPKKFRGNCRHCGVEGHHGNDCPQKPKRACFNCGEEGHTKSECLNPKKFNGPCKHCGEEGHPNNECPQKPELVCHNCGESGHGVRDCPSPKVFKGACRICSKEGHPASECPDKQPMVCRNCGQEGHAAVACTEARKIHKDREDQPVLPEKELWEQLIVADKEAELEQFREILFEHARACPEITIREYEERFRTAEFQVYLIAMRVSMIGNQTLVNLQGLADQKYVVKLQLGSQPKRKRLVQGITASSPEENLKWLEESGFPMDSFKSYCIRCKETGHTTKSCPEAPAEGSMIKKDQTTIRDRPEVPSGSVWNLPLHERYY